MILVELGKKVISFEEERLSVKIEHTGKFFETLPILKSSRDSLTWDKNQIMLQNASGAMLIKFINSTGINASLIETELNNKVCYGFKIRAEKKLEYEIDFQ